MPFPDFFHQFGIFSVNEFLPTALCNEICAEMQRATVLPGTIWNPGAGDHVEEEVKKRKEVLGLPAETVSKVTSALVKLIPALSVQFGAKLNEVQPIKFTQYDVGDYYRIHRDVSPNHDVPTIIKVRKISIIIFLNEEGDLPGEGDYCGGNLTFYGLMEDPEWHGIGLPLESEAGLLVAFRPDTIHEVTPVTYGTRYAIATWFA